MSITATSPFSTEDLQRMKEEVFEVNTANGWFEADRHFEEGIALIHSEIAEMLEAYRDHGLEDVTTPDDQIVPTIIDGETVFPLAKPEGVGSEAADILIRFLDEAHRQEVDIEPHEWYVRPDDDAGLAFGRHCARLHRIVSQWDGNVGRVTHWGFSKRQLDSTMSAGLAMAYSRLVYLCESFDIDLPFEYARKIAYNATRGHRHGGKRL